MHSRAFIFLLFFYSIKRFVAGTGTDSFVEELFVKTLPTGQMYSHFQFTTTWNTTFDSEESKHYRLFPRPLGEIFDKFSVKELHLSLSQNRWRHESWGYPIVDASKGAELLVWFSPNVRDVDKQWLALINVLSGMFCASMNFMDSKVAVTPRFNLRPKGVSTKQYEKHFSSHVRYASLPNENVCTENLTPWKKLLPCGFKAGLSSMLNAIKLYDASYHSISVHFRHVCKEETCSSTALELSQGLGTVFDPSINLGTDQPNWSFKKYFGRMMSNVCPLASSSMVYVDVSQQNIILTPSPSHYSPQGDFAVYDLAAIFKSQGVFNLDAKFTRDFLPLDQSQTTPVVASHFQTGSGQSFGGVVCLIYNKHPTADIFATYLEMLPHFVRMYLHTLKLEVFPGSSLQVSESGERLTPLQVHYVPGKDNGRPYHLELAFILPANSVLRISFQYQTHLQRWIDYPPDANHGFYVAPSIISATLPSSVNITSLHLHNSLISSILQHSTESLFVCIHTEPLLISLPTPDFSMPYNVICLVCTVIAVAFGSVHNITTKSFVLYDPLKHKNFFAKLKDNVTKKIWPTEKVAKSAKEEEKKES